MELLIMSTTDNKGYSYTYQFLADKFNKRKIEMAEWYLKTNGDLLDEEYAYLSRGGKSIIDKGITKEMKLNQNVVWLDRYEDEYRSFINQKVEKIRRRDGRIKKGKK